ncbi:MULTISPECIES: class C sortase [unclassified Enterococcus]|uniref:sortase family protein n=1 Tax=unclassified Enterococcus TaxID=2608891 RepID=UPI001A9B7F5A|nr:class C sortase [Enterococcus sp. DIV1271a]MBO1299614.1 class A/C sortase [Enterococcus sp. DIV1271a]
MNEKKKISVAFILAIVLIVGGTLTLLYPIVGNYLANRERSSATIGYDHALEKLTEKDIENEFERAKVYNERLFQQQQGKAVNLNELDYKTLVNSAGVMGTLDIPSLDIEKMPFYHGTDYLTLDRGLGHFEKSSISIGGENTRSVITGHSGVQNQVLFTDIINLRVGDLFFINVLGKRLAYQIESFEEVLPTEVDKVKIQPGKDMVTLLTCTPPGVNTYRLLVNGVRVPYEEALNKPVVKRNFWSYQNVVLGSLSLCFLIFACLVLRYRYLVKRFRSDNPEKVETARKKLRRLYLLTKGFFVTLVLAMTVLLGVAIYGYTQIQRQQEIGTINIGENSELADYNLKKISEASYTEEDIASVNLGNYSNAKINFQQTVNDWGIGKLMIPNVQIDLPILAGMNNENLMNGVATYTKKQQLGMDNYVLLAHNIFDQDVLLNRISQLNMKDKIYATDFKDLYIYEVSYNEVVEDTQVELLELKKAGSKAMITLVRCEGDIGTRYRRVVQGKLVSVRGINEMDETELDEIGFEKNSETIDGTIVKNSPIEPFNATSMIVASRVVSDPLQTLIPIVFFLLVPVILFNIV